jgi:hypothetical protein
MRRKNAVSLIYRLFLGALNGNSQMHDKSSA